MGSPSHWGPSPPYGPVPPAAPVPPVAQLLLQAATVLVLCCWRALLCAAAFSVCVARFALAALGVVSPAPPGDNDGVVFYVGTVWHERRAPVKHGFSYPVRMALIDLDSPPAWHSASAGDFLTADAARAAAGTAGRVHLLCTPPAAGYVQNPISVYYCADGDASLGRGRCLAEVTNTPWGARVTFGFDPRGDTVPKALHVSPFMDMAANWRLVAPRPAGSLRLEVHADHPVHGRFFSAVLTARADADSRPSERGSLWTLLKHGFQPQRIAVGIYWEALRLLWKGVSLHGPPAGGPLRRSVMARTTVVGVGACPAYMSTDDSDRVPFSSDVTAEAAGGRQFVWRRAQQRVWR